MTERRHVNERTGEVIDDPQIRPFADFLRDLDAGRTHDKMSEALWDLVARVRDTGKKGSVSLTIVVEPTKGDTVILTVLDEIKLKLPEHARRPSVFFSDNQGNLSRSNPNQPELSGLREISARPTTTTDLREANQK